MKSTLLDRKAPYELIRDVLLERYIRTATESGRKLPSDRELAAEFGVSIATISKSISSLVADNLVERRVGSGTYIKDITSVKQGVGIYLGAHTMSYTTPHLMMYSIMDDMLQNALNSAFGGYLHYADMRIPETQGTPMPALRMDADAGRLSDLIVCRANANDFAWLDKLPTNVIGFMLNFGRSSVEFDTAEFSRKSVSHLLEQGCRSIALISRTPRIRTARTLNYYHLFNAFKEALESAQLPVRSEWLLTYEFDDTKQMNAQHFRSEEFGYECFQRIWNSKHRPDGLVVYHDVVALGVTRAARDLGVDLHADVKVVVHANLENPWPQLAPYPRMAFSIKEAVDRLVELIGERRKLTHFVSPSLILPDSAA